MQPRLDVRRSTGLRARSGRRSRPRSALPSSAPPCDAAAGTEARAPPERYGGGRYRCASAVNSRTCASIHAWSRPSSAASSAAARGAASIAARASSSRLRVRRASDVFERARHLVARGPAAPGRTGTAGAGAAARGAPDPRRGTRSTSAASDAVHLHVAGRRQGRVVARHAAVQAQVLGDARPLRQAADGDRVVDRVLAPSCGTSSTCRRRWSPGPAGEMTTACSREIALVASAAARSAAPAGAGRRRR